MCCNRSIKQLNILAHNLSHLLIDFILFCYCVSISAYLIKAMEAEGKVASSWGIPGPSGGRIIAWWS